jgi:hypothetical protein
MEKKIKKNLYYLFYFIINNNFNKNYLNKYSDEIVK